MLDRGNSPVCLVTSAATSTTSPLDDSEAARNTRPVSFERKGNLPRLPPHRYQGYAVVFWTNTLEARARGWLTPAFHALFCEWMLHAAARERLFCPAYCLMPDHVHLVRMGLRRETDQRNAMKFLRTHPEPALGEGRQWQHQPHDHVLREKEHQRTAFAKTCFSIRCGRGSSRTNGTGRPWGRSFRGIPRFTPWPTVSGNALGDFTRRSVTPSRLLRPRPRSRRSRRPA